MPPMRKMTKLDECLFCGKSRKMKEYEDRPAWTSSWMFVMRYPTFGIMAEVTVCPTCRKTKTFGEAMLRIAELHIEGVP